MGQLRNITSTRGLNFDKIMDYRMQEGLVTVACIDIQRLATDGIRAYQLRAYATKKQWTLRLKPESQRFGPAIHKLYGKKAVVMA